MVDVNKFKYMKIGLASSDTIRKWSYGEVKKSETINYRTLKPEKDGLFCERIFGPQKDCECACGKYKRIRHEGIVCDRCGVEVTVAKVRRERMGHIELAAPVAHIWYVKGIPSRMGLLLNMSPRELEEVIYFVNYVVIDPGKTDLVKQKVLTEKEYREVYEKWGNEFEVGMGAEAIKKLLESLDLDKLAKELRSELKVAQGQKRGKVIKRLEVVESFRNSGNRPEWMILDVLPVIPPELRPMVQLDGGRFATSDLNDLYRRVINRNNRLIRYLEIGAPNIIINNEKRMIQESVDALIDNGRRGRPVTGPGNRPLKSLSHMLKGKQGRFRQNLLGKRVDYSGRSVIVVGPDLKMYQCGLPKEMALELFKPFVMKELVERDLAQNIKSAKKMIERMDDALWDVVEDVIREHPVLLNRAPTLHRLGIQAFEPKIVEGRAIRLHPLVTTAFNADFDGDQMAVHVPLSQEAQAEARLLMLAANNILNPKDGKPVVTPSQDMVLGNYYLTMEEVGAIGEGNIYKDTNELMMAYANGYVTLHSRIALNARALNNMTFTEDQNNKYIITTLGKVIFNGILPKTFPYLNEPTMKNLQGATPSQYFVEKGTDIKAYLSDVKIVSPFKKKFLGDIISEVFRIYKTTETSRMLDRLKDLGFKYSTVAGISVGVADVVVSSKKKDLLKQGDDKVAQIQEFYNRGLLTDDERYRLVIDVWAKVKDEIQHVLMNELPADNHIYMMSDSGARGNASNFTQLAGMRGLMANPSGKTIELPIKSSFREGLTVTEFFISTHGARKGLADTALKTADSGYLTRRLVDVAQDVIVREDDCGTDKGQYITELKQRGQTVETLFDRIVGRYTAKPIYHPVTKEKIADRNVYISDELGKIIVDAGIEGVDIRTIYSCNAQKGVCKKCYGQNLATGKEVEVGEAVGIMAAQSIGEPGTQLTMRTFHTGGVAGADITQGLPRIQELFEARNPKGRAIIAEIDGVITTIKANTKNRYEITLTNKLESRNYLLPYGVQPLVSEGDEVLAGDMLTEGSIDPKELLRVKDVAAVQAYILKEVQNVYRAQGVELSDKHIEIMVHQMMKKVKVIDGGDTDILPGSLIDITHYTRVNAAAIQRGKRPAVGIPTILGITKASLETESFLSAASFQETTRVLTDAAIKGKVDELIGLKENVIIGKLIPAGTGVLREDHILPVHKNEDELEDDVLPYELEMSGISNSESQIDISLEDDLDELDIELDFDETDFLDTDEE
ncbi:MAG: DNA-directed RNA polymerase subunit beta' [Turicibacter sp.]|uniref:DNA-directed RNA polymerase subunit beta' n=1 Tax=Turicibacter faecis TaxID=2963365 RepID=A0ABN6ZA89_9FIRM|nr:MULTISPECIES: DNA-directed RNA polymerase subunit beta' [unclassified Turicibacter]MCI8701053.1 DNA-directed RNA polymerase subunit beta' [Turicibacter sp.]BEH89959.1 DNA-directed RNA polymerase subunit beta' [Turicibacter sp. TC023]MCU7203633.1 DNA-directed RNA polymerase subunit beta' [Turicibacter sp. TA25]MCU7209013.1 DNA-directed RNA polymerase subunit beta' [Turicibacter sp. 1E2]NCE78295.1 DNA-directed RNA polymerase subunit beta' [Turicibacter sp. TS3]